jgi:hypothetical protein
LASAISSFIVVTGSEGCTTATCGDLAVIVIGAKSTTGP